MRSAPFILEIDGEKVVSPTEEEIGNLNNSGIKDIIKRIDVRPVI